tara:strand:+ start:698 stop:1993 length:1296 start_codon:yes stop_codon:yes gene_type:complete
MKINDLLVESTEHNLPGAASGIKVMSPEEFASQGNISDEEVDEATALPASTRELKGQELTDYLDRIRGTADVNKKTGQVKVDKKGKEKYVSGKTARDKYVMPYVHRASVMSFYSPEGKKYNIDAMKAAMKQRPTKLLKQNEKMKHSNGAYEQFFNIGFAALVGSAVDENTNEIIIVNTCPGAGSCKVDCFAMKGGKIQYEGPWLSDARILTYLLNDPTGFKAQLDAEIKQEAKEGKEGSRGFEKGWQVSVRWHDAGDFFSPEYLGLAFDIARANPTVKFYAYTKVAAAVLGKKPDNFMINWSEGASSEQEKKVKAQDPNLSTTKNSRIVPEKLFWDLLKKDAKGNLDKEGANAKGVGGRWVTRDASATSELKQRLAKEYGLSANSILNYDEYMAKRNSIPQGMKYNVIVAPGEGDISANDDRVLSTLLLKH